MSNGKYGSVVTNLIEPFKVEGFFEEQRFNDIKDYFVDHEDFKSTPKSYYLSKKISSYSDDFLKKLHIELLPIVRKTFSNDSIIPSYALLLEYSGGDGHVSPHMDEGPCSFTIDLCLYENSDWPLDVDNKVFSLKPNDAIFFHGSRQMHSRTGLQNQNNHNVVILFHYDLPEHKFFLLPESLQKMYVPQTGKDYIFKLVDEFNDMSKPHNTID
jgi:hypothetical protein